MKIEISKKTDNPLFSRAEIPFNIQHNKGEATPSRKQVKDALGAKLGANKELLVVKSIVSPRGEKSSNGVAYLYKDKKAFDSLAKEYLKKRDAREPKAPKAPVGQVPVEEAPKEEEKKEGAPKEEEKPSEEEKKEAPKEEKAEEPKTEPKVEEKVEEKPAEEVKEEK